MSNKSLFRWFAIALAGLSVSAVPALADFMTGFEPPTYSLGALNGQNGWSVFGPGVVTVEGFNVFAGTQAVFVDGGSSAVSQSGPYHVDTAGSVVSLSAEIYLASSSVETGWQFAATGPDLTGFAGGIDIYPTADPLDSSVVLITGNVSGSAGTFVRNQWNLVDLLLNYNTQTYDVFIDGSEIGTDLAFCGNNSPPCNGATVSAYADGLFDTFGATPGSDDSGYMDNYAVATTPEPESLILLASVLVLLLAARRILGARAAAE